MWADAAQNLFDKWNHDPIDYTFRQRWVRQRNERMAIVKKTFFLNEPFGLQSAIYRPVPQARSMG